MSATLDRPASRNWTDLLAILTGVALPGIAIWPGTPTATADADRETTVTSAFWLGHIASGSLAVLAVFVAQRWQRRPIARLLLVAAALVSSER